MLRAMKYSFFLCMGILILTILCCDMESKTTNQTTVLDSIKIEEHKIQESDTTLTSSKKPKTITALTFLIDSLYEIKKPRNLDTLKNFKLIKKDRHGIGPKGLDLSKAKEYITYDRFSFITFDSAAYAANQFNEALEISPTRFYEQDNPLSERYLQLFSKAGSSYILFDKMIIYHERRCSYDEKIELPREAAFLDLLFDGKSPENKYFLRVRCGWSKLDVF